MKRGETVRIISDLYGDAGKTGTVYDVAEEECWRNIDEELRECPLDIL